jgi:LL-diaminopimelate aminotransferase
MESFLQNNFAERIGGRRFGKDDTVYKFEKIKRAKRAATAANPDVPLIDMGVGEPDEPAFAEVVQTLREQAGKRQNRFYTDNGIAVFKEAVQRYMRRMFGVELDAQTEINHSIGSKSALALLPACFINPGDLTVLTIPGYPVLGTWTRYLGGEVATLPLTKENGFFPDLTLLTAGQCRRAKLLYLNYPNNPTGTSATPAQFEAAVDFCRRHRILIVSDAAYAPLNFAGKPLSILTVPGAAECALELHSMSKGFNMTGWRLGWVCGNRQAISAFASVKDNTDSGQFAAIQLAAAAGLDQAERITPAICEKYQRRLSALTAILGECGFDARMPDGSFYLYVEVPNGTRSGEVFESGEAFSQWLITEKLVSTVPWDDAGHFVRFSATFEADGIEAEQRVLDDLKRRLSDVAFVF